MYAFYNKIIEADRSRFTFSKRISLFGCNVGLIPRLLREYILPDQGEPYPWHLSISKTLLESGYPNLTILIDLKPKQNKDNLSLYELMDVWGYSSSGWTPILLHLSGLFVDEDPSKYDRNDFWIEDSRRDEPIYEFLYIQGSVSNGKLSGSWTSPPVSPTNAALLWPSTLIYFIECIKKRTPDILKALKAPVED